MLYRGWKVGRGGGGLLEIATSMEASFALIASVVC